MKKIISVLLIFAFAVSFMTACNAAGLSQENAEQLRLILQIGNPVMTVNGTETHIDENGTVPIVENGRTLVPIRAIIEAIGGYVEWEADTNTAVLKSGNDTVTLVIGSTTAYFNERQDTLDSAPQIINDRTMLPIRYIAESFNFKVDWNDDTQEITITKDAAITPDISKDNKILVVYYSASGNTKEVANYIKNAVNADIFELEPIDEYSAADLDWTDNNSRVNQEHEDETKRDVELKNATPENWSDYDTVFIGYPIWWGIAAWPVNTFVKSNDFSGKTVIPFCTSASSGIGESGKLLAETAGTGGWQDGMRFRSGARESDVADWVKNILGESEE